MILHEPLVEQARTVEAALEVRAILKSEPYIVASSAIGSAASHPFGR
jgi:hypothetical protein